MTVAIVTPAYDGRVHDDHARSVDAGRQALAKRGVRSVRICLTGDAVLPRVRNQCVAEALARGAERIVMVDSDIGFDPDMLVRLISHDAPIVGAAPQAQLKNWRDAAAPRCVWRPFPGEAQTDARGLVRAQGVATGFMAARAEVFGAMVKQGKARRYVYPGTSPASWPHLATYFDYALVALDLENDPALRQQCDAAGVPEEAQVRWEGEDYSFCARARECGFESFMDAGLAVRHWEGRAVHDFSVAESMAWPADEVAAA
jgi:hypothetical protein